MPNKNESGFTLVELLIVIGIISILVGVTLSVINVTGQRNRAQDSIRQANMSKLVLGLKAYQVVEGRWPSDPNSDGNPMDDPLIGTYIDTWPNNEPTAGTTYSYWVDASRTSMGLTVATTRGSVYKYRSEWPKSQECQTVAPSNTTCVVFSY